VETLEVHHLLSYLQKKKEKNKNKNKTYEDARYIGVFERPQHMRHATRGTNAACNAWNKCGMQRVETLEVHTSCPTKKQKNKKKKHALIFDRTSTSIPKEQEGLPLITLIDPGTSVYSSLQNCHTWNYSQGDGDKTIYTYIYIHVYIYI
jgi:hypothetical protein